LKEEPVIKRLFSLALMGIVMLLGACTQIDTGNVGVERTIGKVSPETLPQGVYFTMFKTVDEFTTKEIAVSFDNMAPKSKDNLSMQDVDLDIYFRVNPAKVAALFIKYQGDVRKLDNGDSVVGFNRVSREGREAIYKAFADFDATTMHTKRNEVGQAIQKALQKALDDTDKEAFVITNINVRNMVTDPAIEQAIRNAAAKDKEIEAKQKELALEKAETARQMEVVERIAKADVLRAQATAKANEILAASITPQVLKMREIEAQRAIAAKDGNTTIMVPYGAQPLVSVR
jgi:hypothetical protein